MMSSTRDIAPSCVENVDELIERQEKSLVQLETKRAVVRGAGQGATRHDEHGQVEGPDPVRQPDDPADDHRACLTIYYAKNNSRQNSLVEENERRHLQYRRGELGGGARLGLITNARPAETGTKE